MSSLMHRRPLTTRPPSLSDLWRPLTAAEWRNTPTISGRSATEADVQAGIAVFSFPNASSPHPISLPACAVHRDAESGRFTHVVVIQAEVHGGEVYLGARPLAGGTMVCTLGEVEFVAGLTARAEA